MISPIIRAKVLLSFLFFRFVLVPSLGIISAHLLEAGNSRCVICFLSSDVSYPSEMGECGPEISLTPALISPGLPSGC